MSRRWAGIRAERRGGEEALEEVVPEVLFPYA